MVDACLGAVAASDFDGAVECLLVANGCTDDTAERARRWQDRFAARGWALRVLDLPDGGKLGALNAGDRAASFDTRVYLDADVVISKPALGQIGDALAESQPAYASGTVQIPRPDSWVTRAYRAFYVQVPFMTHGVPGCGLFAVNGTGRARWEDWPDIISDDTFARLSFAPEERHLVPATYEWPLVEGLGALIRVRRRQDAGVAELQTLAPQLFDNDDKPRFTKPALARAVARAPMGFLVYATVAMAVRLTRGRVQGWSRGR